MACFKPSFFGVFLDQNSSGLDSFETTVFLALVSNRVLDIESRYTRRGRPRTRPGSFLKTKSPRQKSLFWVKPKNWASLFLKHPNSRVFPEVAQSNPWSPADLLSQVRHITCMAKSPYVYLCKNKFSIFYSGFRYSRHYHSVYYNESITHISSDTEPAVRKKRAL